MCCACHGLVGFVLCFVLFVVTWCFLFDWFLVDLTYCCVVCVVSVDYVFVPLGACFWCCVWVVFVADCVDLSLWCFVCVGVLLPSDFRVGLVYVYL